MNREDNQLDFGVIVLFYVILEAFEISYFSIFELQTILKVIVPKKSVSGIFLCPIDIVYRLLREKNKVHEKKKHFLRKTDSFISGLSRFLIYKNKSVSKIYINFVFMHITICIF